MRLAFALVLSLSLAAAAQSLKTDDEKSLYALGYLMGSRNLAPLSLKANELEIVRRIPGGSNTGWTVSVGPFPDGLPNPRTCPSDPHRQHWLLVRGVKRNTTQRKAPAYSS